MAIMQCIMEDKTIDKLIEIRKCMRMTVARMILEVPDSDITRDLQHCLSMLEQLIIRGIRDTYPPQDNGPNS